jgi:CubicO group peptidase (beta-lactamase class C family)
VNPCQRLGPVLAVAALLTVGVAARQNPVQTLDLGNSAFEGYIELLRQQAGIPALSGVLIQDRVIAWERGLGFANLEAKIAARPDTPYAVGDLTEIFTSVLLLRCAEERQLALNDPIRAYGGGLPERDATIRQVLSHTSAGGVFRFDPERYAQLTPVVEDCGNQPFRKAVAVNLLDRLAMAGSVPGRDFGRPGGVAADVLDRDYFEHYGRVLENLAIPYRVDKRGHAARAELPLEGVNAATGMVSTARDLAQFDLALDAGILLREDSLIAAWTPAATQSGVTSPTGLGWFVQNYRGTTIVWQFGVVGNAYSAMIVKVPSRRVTMILLANSDGLAIPFQLEAGDVTRSPFASVLLRMLL